MPTLVSPVQNVLLVAATAFVAALAFTPLVSRLALARGWLQPEDGPRLGRVAVVPRVGGVAVVAAFAVALLALPPFETWLDGVPAPVRLPLVAAAAFLAAVGLVQDVRGLPRQVTAAAQFAAALFLFWSGYRVDDLAVPFWHEVRLAELSLPFTVAWLLVATNFFDVVRGLDGLTGGLALATTLALFGAAAGGGHWGEAGVLVAVAGALAGFARFNFHPAHVFLGRCGSRPIGLVLGALAVSGRLKSPAVLAAVVPLLALVLPLLDVALPSGDRPRLPHRIVLAGYAVAVAIATMTLVRTEGPPLAFAAAVAALLLAAAVTMRGVGRWQASDTQRWVVGRLAESLRPSGDSTLRALEEDLARADDLESGVAAPVRGRVGAGPRGAARHAPARLGGPPARAPQLRPRAGAAVDRRPREGGDVVVRAAGERRRRRGDGGARAAVSDGVRSHAVRGPRRAARRPPRERQGAGRRRGGRPRLALRHPVAGPSPGRRPRGLRCALPWRRTVTMW